MLDPLIMALANIVLCALHPRLVWRYRNATGRWPDVGDPKRYSERMLWRKIVDHDPSFVTFTDKLATKDYCRRICPDLKLPRVRWIGNDADAIPDEALAGDVFVKTTHGFNFNYPIRNGRVDRRDLKERTDRWLRSTHGRGTGQWAYGQVEPRLFVEEAIGDASRDLLDLSIRAGNGRAILGSVAGHHKLPGAWTVYLDAQGEPTAGTHDEDGQPPRPLPAGIDVTRAYRLARRYAEILSRGVDYARFDFMWNGSDLFGGEITVYPASGTAEITNTAAHDAIVGNWDLRVSHFLRSAHVGPARWYAAALARRISARATLDHGARA